MVNCLKIEFVKNNEVTGKEDKYSYQFGSTFKINRVNFIPAKGDPNEILKSKQLIIEQLLQLLGE